MAAGGAAAFRLPSSSIFIFWISFRLLELESGEMTIAGHLKQGGQKGRCSLKFFGSQLQFVLKDRLTWSL